MYRGSCLCGVIHYEVNGPITEMGHCHCKMCQKSHGTAFATYAKVSSDDFRFVAGFDSLAEFRSSEETTRTFCRECGSNLQFIRTGRSHFGIAVGTLDDDLEIEPTYQIWTGSKVCWWQLQVGLLSHESQPGRDDKIYQSQATGDA
jgi:hypothetical protein